MFLYISGLEFLAYLSSTLDNDMEAEMEHKRYTPPQGSEYFITATEKGARTPTFCIFENYGSTGKNYSAANLSSGWGFRPQL